jgi:hypothetical protein
MDESRLVGHGGAARPGQDPAAHCTNAAKMEGGPMDTVDRYEPTWHEDDELHQAEGMISWRLGISVDEAVYVIRRRAEASTLTLSEAATQVLDEAKGPAR